MNLFFETILITIGVLLFAVLAAFFMWVLFFCGFCMWRFIVSEIKKDIKDRN